LKSDILNLKEVRETECEFHGLGNKSIKLEGITTLDLIIEDKHIPHDFYILGNLPNLKTDGILGRDFLEKYQCIIDYQSYTLQNNVEEVDLIIPMNMNFHTYFNTTIPSRSEIIHKVDLNINEDCIINSREIQKGVFIANCIIPKNGFKHIKILNTTEKDIPLKDIC